MKRKFFSDQAFFSAVLGLVAMWAYQHIPQRVERPIVLALLLVTTIGLVALDSMVALKGRLFPSIRFMVLSYVFLFGIGSWGSHLLIEGSSEFLITTAAAGLLMTLLVKEAYKLSEAMKMSFTPTHLVFFYGAQPTALMLAWVAYLASSDLWFVFGLIGVAAVFQWRFGIYLDEKMLHLAEVSPLKKTA